MTSQFDTIALRLFYLATLLVALQGAGCGDEASDERVGYTECGSQAGEAIFCNPAQYCFNNSFQECATGCVSNVNCSEGESCSIDDGSSVGSCVAQSTTANNTTTDAGMNADYVGVCDSLCRAYNDSACFAPGDLDSCFAACETTSEGNLETFFTCDGETFCDLECFQFLPDAQIVGSERTTGSDAGESDTGGADMGTPDTGTEDTGAGMDTGGTNLAACRAECEAYSENVCLDFGELDVCWSACEGFPEGTRQQFIDCDGAVFCDSDCLRLLGL